MPELEGRVRREREKGERKGRKKRKRDKREREKGERKGREKSEI